MRVFVPAVLIHALVAAAPFEEINVVFEGVLAAAEEPYVEAFLAPPVNFHLALAGQQTDGMAIAWESGNYSTTRDAVCWWGTTSGQLDRVTTGSVRSDGAVHTHIVVLSKLLPATRYYYVCGDAANGFSNETSFVSGRRPASTDQFSFAVIGDMGVNQGEDVMGSLERHPDQFEFVYHVGDVGYADNYWEHNQFWPGATYDTVYQQFMRDIEPIASTHAWMVLPGNHEATCNEASPNNCPSRQSNFTAYNYRWRMPSQESGGAKNMWYSFDYGLIHFVQIDTETDFPNAPEGVNGDAMRYGPFGDQLSWLRTDLAKAYANRGRVPWIIVSGHRPIIFSRDRPYLIATRAAFQSLLEEFKVDIYIAGHEHLYERYWPVSSTGQIEMDYQSPSYPIYLIVGNGGNNEGLDQPTGTDPNFFAYRENQYWGWGLVTVNSSGLDWKLYTSADEVSDHIVITK